MSGQTESVEGYVIDIACVRKSAREGLLGRAREHSRDCCLHGHCIESGYALVSDDDTVTLLDPAATPLVVDIVEGVDEGTEGIRLRATREERDGTMHTADAELIET